MPLAASEAWTARTALLLGQEGVDRLAAASVAVFGLGGVGSYAAEALARAGVGRLILVDGDVVEETNLNRQLVALHSTLGRSKAEVAAQRVLDIAPGCRAEAHAMFYLPEQGQGLIDGCDYVADCIDMVSAKLALAEECRDKGIPLISAMGCGNRLDPTRFRVTDIYETSGCPLCRVMRRELRRREIPALKVVYSDAPARTPAVSPGEGRPSPGSLSFVPGAAGLILAGEIVRFLAGTPAEEQP